MLLYKTPLFQYDGSEWEHVQKKVYETLSQVSFIMALIMIAFVAFGIVGNVVSVLVYTQPTMFSSINVLLCGLSSIDLALLVLVIPVYTLTPLPIWDKERRYLSHYEAYMLRVSRSQVELIIVSLVN